MNLITVGHLAIYVIFTVFALGIGVYVYVLSSSPKRRKPKRNSRERETDNRQETKLERKARRDAHVLVRQKKFLAAASLLESAGLTRESIDVLEQAGMVREAASVLMRIQRPNRAGYILEKHKKWRDAWQCYKVAGLSDEVARCAEKAGDWAEARDHYIMAERPLDAARCHLALKEYRPAAKILMDSGKFREAIRYYHLYLSECEDLKQTGLERKEIKLIIDYVASGGVDSKLLEFLDVVGELAKVVLLLCRKGKNRRAEKLMRLTGQDIATHLMAEVSYEDGSAKVLAEVFHSVGQPRFAGMIHERLEEFAEAGECFEAEGDYARASYCYNRVGNKEKVAEMREMLRSTMGKGSKKYSDAGVFSLEDVTESTMAKRRKPDLVMPAELSEEVEAEEGPNFGKRPASSSSFHQQEPDVTEVLHTESKNSDANYIVARTYGLFAEASDIELEKLMAISRTITTKVGDRIASAGEAVDGVGVILVGQLKISGEGIEEEAYLEEGDGFGEVSTLQNQAHAYDLEVSIQGSILFWPAAELVNLLDQEGGLARKVFQSLMSRMMSDPGSQVPFKQAS